MNTWQKTKSSLTWIRIAFTFGNASETKRKSLAETAASVEYDGMISAIQMFLFVIVLSSTLAFTSYASRSFDDNVCLVTLTIYMFIGIFVMFMFSYHSKKVLVSAASGIRNESSRDDLTPIGITLFFVLASLLDIFHVIFYIDCDEAWKTCPNHYVYASYVVGTVYHVVRIVYLGGETFLCITLNKSLFVHKPSTRYGLMFLQAVNFSLWFDAFVNESSQRFSSPLNGREFSFSCLNSGSNFTEHELGCLTLNNSMTGLIVDTLSPIFLPCMIEFTLLVGECFANWYLYTATVNSKRLPELPGYNAHEMVDSTAEENTSYNTVDGCDGTINAVVEYDPDNEMFDDSGSFSFTDSDDSDMEPSLSVVEATPTTVTSKACVYIPAVFFIIFFAINLPPCVFSIYQRYATGAELSRYRTILMYYLICQWVSMTATVFIGYHVSSKFKVNRNVPFSAFEYMILFSSSGPLVVNFLSLISVGEVRHNLNETTFGEHFQLTASHYIAAEVINLVEIYFEVVFNLFAARVIVESNDTSWRAVVFRLTVLYLGVANFFLWLVANGNNVPMESNIFREYFSDYGWLYIRNITIFFPVSMLFRFMSTLQYFRVFEKLVSSDGVHNHQT